MPEDVDKSPAEAPPADATAAPTSRKKLTLIASGLLLVGGGAAAAWYLGMPPFGARARHAQATAAIEDDAHDEADADEEHGGGHGESGGHGDEGHAGKGKGAGGPMLPLDTFIANLADDGGKRYLKTTMQVEFLGDGVPKGLDARLPQIRDLLLTLLTSKTFDEIRTPEGKQQLREEIITRLNQTLDRDAVKAVYFTEFIVQ